MRKQARETAGRLVAAIEAWGDEVKRGTDDRGLATTATLPVARVLPLVDAGMMALRAIVGRDEADDFRADLDRLTREAFDLEQNIMRGEADPSERRGWATNAAALAEVMRARLVFGEPAEAAAGEPPAVLTAEAWAALRLLGERLEAMTRQAIIDRLHRQSCGFSFDEKTWRKHFVALIDEMLVEDKGKSFGLAITPKGQRQLSARIDPR